MVSLEEKSVALSSCVSLWYLFPSMEAKCFDKKTFEFRPHKIDCARGVDSPRHFAAAHARSQLESDFKPILRGRNGGNFQAFWTLLQCSLVIKSDTSNWSPENYLSPHVNDFFGEKRYILKMTFLIFFTAGQFIWSPIEISYTFLVYFKLCIRHLKPWNISS